MGVMNTVTSADSSYYAANTNEKTEKGPCLAMTPYGVIGAERVKTTPFKKTQRHSLSAITVALIGNQERVISTSSSVPACQQQHHFQRYCSTSIY